MGLKLTFELSDEDLAYFSRVFRDHGPGDSVELDPAEICPATDRLIEEARGRGAPPFIVEKLARLRELVEMVRDEDWQLPASDAQRVLRALAYFADPADLIPDDLPVLGYLDDAMMVDVALREVEPEFMAYRDFCRFREEEAARRQGSDAGAPAVSRADWLDARRRQLHERMRTKRQRLFHR
jgi:uncharacterized membrane protein YkvA (DUF1232 family)